MVYGGIAVVSADNLGSLALGGFKESCTALKMCRYCMTTRAESQKQVFKTILTDNCMLLIIFYSFLKEIFNFEMKMKETIKLSAV